jgi:hypothetical protein
LQEEKNKMEKPSENTRRIFVNAADGRIRQG